MAAKMSSLVQVTDTVQTSLPAQARSQSNSNLIIANKRRIRRLEVNIRAQINKLIITYARPITCV